MALVDDETGKPGIAIYFCTKTTKKDTYAYYPNLQTA